MNVMVFTEGTITMPSCGKNVTREERVEQVKKELPEVNDFGSYIPVGNAVDKLSKWSNQGATICYLTSRTSLTEIQIVEDTLRKYGFPKGSLYYRKDRETYAGVAEKVMPGVLIEDDCESIGGEVEMTYPHIKQEKKDLIKSIVVKEFAGIDDLPDDIEVLFKF